MDFAKQYGSRNISVDMDGTWVKFDDDTRIKIVTPNSRKEVSNRLNSMTVEEMMDEFVTPYDMSKPDEVIKAKVEHDVKRKAFLDQKAAKFFDRLARTTASRILDWEGMSDDGVDLKYTPEIGFQYCFDFPEFRQWVDSEFEKLIPATEIKEAKLKAVKKK